MSTPPTSEWEAQMFFLASHGYRCIGHDRRAGGTHALGDTHEEQLNADLLAFIHS